MVSGWGECKLGESLLFKNHSNKMCVPYGTMVSPIDESIPSIIVNEFDSNGDVLESNTYSLDENFRNIDIGDNFAKVEVSDYNNMELSIVLSDVSLRTEYETLSCVDEYNVKLKANIKVLKLQECKTTTDQRPLRYWEITYFNARPG